MTLRRALSAILLAALGPAAGGQTAGEPFPLPRVGAEVDAGERAYFLLFPSLGAADTLRLAWAGPDSVRVAGAGPALVVSARQARALGEVVAGYEALFAASEPASEPADVAGLLRWRLPTTDRPPVVVTLRGGAEVAGRLLDADAEGVVVAVGPPPAPDAWRTDGLLFVRAADVVRVHQVGFKRALDVRPGGSAARYADEALPALRRRAVYLRGLPPELRAWRRSRPAPLQAEAPAPDPRVARAPLNRWEVGARAHAGALGAGATSTDPYGVQAPFTDEWDGRTWGAGVGVAYNATARLGAEVSVRYRASEQMEGVGIERRRYAALTADVAVRYAVVRPRLLRPALSVRAGLSLARLGTVTEIEFGDEGEPFPAADRVETSALRPGGVLGVEASVRLARGVSVVAASGWAVYPGLREAEIVLREPERGFVVKHVEARTVDLRLRGVEAGLVVHLGGW